MVLVVAGIVLGGVLALAVGQGDTPSVIPQIAGTPRAGEASPVTLAAGRSWVPAASAAVMTSVHGAPATSAASGAGAAPTTSAASGSPTAPTTSAAWGSPTAPSPSPGAATSGAPLASSGSRAVVDGTLLSVLPPFVTGLAVREFPEAESEAVADAGIGRNISRLATAFVGDVGGANWAYTAIVDVRPEARSDAFYRDWQESFDRSACERAGGVTGHTSVVIAGYDVERTACGGGVRTYHVRIAGTGLLISISDLGEAKFGELEIAGLRS